MTKRLMWSLLLAMLVIMTVSVMLTVSATSKVLTGRQELLLREVVDIVSNGYMVGGEDFVERFNGWAYRKKLKPSFLANSINASAMPSGVNPS